MSSKGLIQHNATHVIGTTNDHKQVILAPRSEYEEQDVCFSNLDASWGNVSCVDIHLDPNQQNIIDDCVWNFELSNTSGTDTILFKHPLFLIYSLEVKVNTTKVFELSGPEEVKVKVLNYYMRYSSDAEQVKRKWLADCGLHSSDYALLGVAPGSTTRFEASMIPLLDELLSEHRARKTGKISLTIKFNPNSNDPLTIQRFMKNATANVNPLSFTSMNNHKLVLYLKRYASDAVQKTPGHTEILRLADVEEKSNADFTVVGNTFKIKLSDFSERKKISHVTWYGYVNTDPTYNSPVALIHEANPAFWRVNVKRAGKPYKDLDSTPRMLRELHSFQKAASGSNNQMDPTTAEIVSRYPLSLVNFSHLHNGHSHNHADIVDGVSNKANREYELTLSTANAGANYTLVYMSHYQELLHITDDGKVIVEA